jgi:hypothetical protein
MEGKRSADRLAIAFTTAPATAGGTSSRLSRKLGIGAAEWWARTTSGVGPMKGALPASISYKVQARLY